MVHKTPEQWWSDQLSRVEMFAENEFEDYLESGNGGLWMLAIADGLRALQAYCLAQGGTMVILSDGAISQ